MTVEFHLRTASDLGVPTNTSGSTRPLMQMDRPIHTVHYTGLRPDQIWFSGGDGVFDSIDPVYRFLRRLEEVARRLGKPFEYNTLIPIMADNSAHVLAYADEYVAAHSAGENPLAHGTLFITGVGQELNDGAILAFRWWNAVLRASGRLSSSSVILPHDMMSDASTACPGVKVRNRLPELRMPYVEEPPPPPVQPQPEPNPSDPIQEYQHMLYIIQPAFPGATPETAHLVKFEDGHLERAFNSTYAYAKAAGLPVVPETSPEHYQAQFARVSDIPVI